MRGMQSHHAVRGLSRVRLMAAAGTMCAASGALGQTWDGGGADDNFTTAANWAGDVVPVNTGTATLMFGGTARLTPSVNTPYQIGGLRFSQGSGAFVIGGSAVTLFAGGLINENTNQPQRINANLNIRASQVWNLGTGSSLTLGGFMDSNSVVTLGGAGSLTILTGVSGAGTINKVGTGLLQLSGAFQGAGVLALAGGTTRLGTNNPIAETAFVNVGAGALLDLNGFSETLGTLSMATGATVNVPGASSLTLANSVVLTLAGTFAGEATGTIRFVGSQAVNVLGQSTFAGTYDVVASTLSLASGERLADDCTLLMNTGVIIMNGVETVARASINGGIVSGTVGSALFANEIRVGAPTINVRLTGPGGLLKDTSGVATLNVPCTYAGTTTVTAGTLRAGVTGAIPPANGLIVGPSAELQLGPNVNLPLATMLGGGSVQVDQGATLSLGFGNASQTLTSPIRGTGGLVKVGTGTLVLNATNTYSGQTRVDSGVLQVASDAHLGAAGTPLAIRGGATLRTTSPLSLARPLTILGPGAGTIDAGADLTIAQPVNITTGGDLVKVGPGTLILSATTEVGAFIVNTGDLILTPGTTLRTLGPLTLASGVTLDASLGVLNVPLIVNGGEFRLPPVGSFALDNSGLTLGEGQFSGTLNNRAAGEIRVTPGERLHFIGAGAHANSGLIEVIEADLEVEAPFVNGTPGSTLIFARGSFLRFNGGLTNFGPIASAAGVVEVFGDIDNRAGGSIVVSGAGSMTFLGDVTNQGLIRTSANSHTVFFGALTGGGTYPGAGTVYIEGDLRPGNSPGLAAFGGNLALGAAGSLTIELAGAAPEQFDRVTVAGTAYLDGTLDLRPLGGFRPAEGVSLPIITAGSLVGTFSGIVTSPGAGSLRVRVIAATPNTAARVEVFNCAADLNADGVLDPDDLADYIACFFVQPSCPAADWDGSGALDADDIADAVAAYFAGCE